MKKKSKRKSDADQSAKSPFFNLLQDGTQALHRGQVAQAIRLLERAHRLAPEDPDAALNLGGACILRKKFAQAIAVLEPLSERDPHNPMVWTNLGAAYLGNPVLARDADQRRAIAAFEKAIALAPAAPNVAYNLGLIYRDRQEIAQALHWFRRALQANPNDRDAGAYIRRLTARLAKRVQEIAHYLPISETLGTGGQPTPEQFAALRAAGYKVVVNLAMPDSTGALPDEAERVAAQSMTYVHIPVVWAAPTAQDLAQFFDVIERHADEKVFVHCALNMRVACFVLLYRVIRQGVPLDQARETLHEIWEPNAVWQHFIEQRLAEHSQAH